MDKIAVLIPCYNESKTIAKVIGDWKQTLPEATIYVYDNNSSDGTPIAFRPVIILNENVSITSGEGTAYSLSVN